MISLLALAALAGSALFAACQSDHLEPTITCTPPQHEEEATDV